MAVHRCSGHDTAGQRSGVSRKTYRTEDRYSQNANALLEDFIMKLAALSMYALAMRMETRTVGINTSFGLWIHDSCGPAEEGAPLAAISREAPEGANSARARHVDSLLALA
ncbi:hypothetical protein [Cystobacter fuscus]|uniref:hypothetical protein n=1 Tax=Cystobacter fuscus TaxID=43 RepID=UPI002B2AACD3|nr:hypothetical protein F0U63_43800 [Cystobacter fuscus]